MTIPRTQILALLYIGIWLGFTISTLYSELPFIPHRGDFNHYYASGWLLSRQLIPYCQSFQLLPFSEMQWDPAIPSATNTPFHIFLTMPLALLPVQPAWIIFVSIGTGCGIAALVVLIREMPELQVGIRPLLIFLGFISSYGFLDNLLYSQIQCLLLLLVILGWRAARQGNDGKAALFWGIATALKPVSFLLFFYLLFQRQWKNSLLFIVSGLVVTLLPVFVTGPQLLSGYVNCALPIIERWSTDSLWNISIGGSLYRAMLLVGVDCHSCLPLLKTATVMLSILAAFFVVRTGPRGPKGIDTSVSILSLLGFISLNVAWPSYLVIALLPLATLWSHSLSHRRPGLPIFVFWAALNVKPFVESGPLSANLMLVKSLFLPVTVLALIIFLWRTVRDGRNHGAEPHSHSPPKADT